MSGYIFNILSDFDEDPEIAKERLMAVRTEIPCFACHFCLSGERAKVVISALRDP